MTAPELRAVQAPVVPVEECNLLLAHRNGETGAFAELVQRYRSPVYSYLSRCGVDPPDRDDLFQEIFIKIHRGAHTYDEERPLHPWLFTIVANVVRSYLRRRRVRQLIYSDPPSDSPPPDDPPAGDPNGERKAAARQTITWLEAEIRRLPRVKREVLLLACVEGLPLSQVADALRLPLGTVKTHLRRTRLALAEKLVRLNHAEVSP